MIRRIILLLILTPIVGFGLFSVLNKNASAQSKKFGNLKINYHTNLNGNKLFNIVNFMPGDSHSHTIDIKNEGDSQTEAFVKGDRTGAGGQIDPKLEKVLDFKIMQGTTVLYSQKLSKFFTDSNSGNGISLGNLNKNQTKPFTFTVSFPTSAGNEYQKKKVVFDLTFTDKAKKSDVKGDHDDRDDHHGNNNHDDDRDNDYGHGGWGNRFNKFISDCRSFVQNRFKFR